MTVVFASSDAPAPRFDEIHTAWFGIGFTPTRVVVGFDPGETTGIGIWAVEPRAAAARVELVKIDRAGFRQEDAIAILAALIGDAEWIALIERPPPPKRGPRAAPSHAERYWLDVIDLFARQRHTVRKTRFRKPFILRPRPDEWRAPLGIRTRGIGGSPAGRRESIKQAAISRLELVHGLKVPQPDLAEGLQIAEWGARVVVREFVGVRGSKPRKVEWNV